ncbi:MAG: hypothetical protein V2A34_06760, partial [Lentisphaerota bacterium]
ANPDASIHGNGFVARLSGSTAEFIHILGVMSFGAQPFLVNQNGVLEFQLNPALPGWLFSQKATKASLWRGQRRIDVEMPANTFSFNFLGNILVSYKNPRRRNTFGPGGVRPKAMKVYDLNGDVTELNSPVIAGALARKIRNREISRIVVELG